MMSFIIGVVLLVLPSCATTKFDQYDYFVQHMGNTYLCDTLEEGSYGAAAHDCERVLDGFKLDVIPNPYNVIIIKE